MSKTKKLDIFNLFYSGAAVVILIGVIAKLLEWPQVIHLLLLILIHQRTQIALGSYWSKWMC